MKGTNGVFNLRKELWLFWLCAWVLFVILLEYQTEDHLLSFLLATIFYFISFFASRIIAALSVRKGQNDKPNLIFLIRLCSILLLVALLILVTLLLLLGLNQTTSFSDLPPLGENLLFLIVFSYTLIFASWILSSTLEETEIKEQNRSLKEKLLVEEMNLRTSQLQNLKQQINPHFLFNALNTIYAYALKENKDTPALILKLSELLDYTLYQTEQSSISLEQELDSVDKYLAIEKERFKDSLDLNYQRKNEVDHHIVPLLFLPLIENAFKHGAEENGRFKLEIYLLSAPEMLTFKVFNRCKMGIFKEGLGLSNLRQRLNIAYDDGATLSTLKENGHFQAEIVINFDTK